MSPIHTIYDKPKVPLVVQSFYSDPILQVAEVLSRLGTGRSSCFKIVGFRKGIFDIMVSPDNHLNQTTHRGSWQVTHNLHDDYGHNSFHLDANLLI